MTRQFSYLEYDGGSRGVVGIVDCDCADIKVDKNMITSVFCCAVQAATRDRRLDAVSNEHQP